jgi:hypothetical protein
MVGGTPMIALISLALAGSITLEVESEQTGDTQVNFGQVSPVRGSTDAGQRYDHADGTFLVIEVTATAHWQAEDALIPVQNSYFSPISMTTATTLTRSVARTREDHSAEPTAIDLYVQTVRDLGDASVWVGPSGTLWTGKSATPVTGFPTLVAAGVPLGEPYTHELALELTTRTEGLQQKEVVYTAIIP